MGTLPALTSNSWTTRRWVAISLQFMIRTAIKSESNAEQLRSGIITMADQLDKEPAFVSLWHTSRGQALQSEHPIVFMSSCAQTDDVTVLPYVSTGMFYVICQGKGYNMKTAQIVSKYTNGDIGMIQELLV